MRRKIVVACVISFWLVMMGLLIGRETALTAEEKFYDELSYSGLADETVLMDVFWGQRKVGETRTSRVVTDNGMTIRTAARFSLDGAGIGAVVFSSLARLNREFRIGHLLIKASWGNRQISAVGSAREEGLELKVKGLGPVEQAFTVPNSSGLTLASGLLPTLPTRQLRKGSEWDVPSFDLAAGRIVRGRAKVVSVQKLLWSGEMRNCYRINFTDSLGRRTLTAWAGLRGELLKVEVFGVTLVRRPDAD
jgi:hypothetical protein